MVLFKNFIWTFSQLHEKVIYNDSWKISNLNQDTRDELKHSKHNQYLRIYKSRMKIIMEYSHKPKFTV